jgi:ubiquinone/menaquinone biosynthesis C-methylase UbiE
MTDVASAGPDDQDAARRHFDRWRRAYSRSRLLASLQEKALDQLDLRGDDRLLDVACGAGKLVRAAAPHVQRAVGADLSSGMIAEARRRTADDAPAAIDHIEFVVAPSDRLPFDDAKFTAIVTTTALHHFPDPAAAIREMSRVLAPGGRVLIGDSIRDTLPARLGDAVLRRFERGHVGLQDMAGIERMLTDAGVEVTDPRRVWFGLYAMVAGSKPSPRRR